MRPVLIAALLFSLSIALLAAFFLHSSQRRAVQDAELPQLAALTAALGLSDLAVASEARYTRHPALSDPMAPFMDHPGAMEHFPTGSFWRPPGR
jgi:hypothetical protein